MATQSHAVRCCRSEDDAGSCIHACSNGERAQPARGHDCRPIYWATPPGPDSHLRYTLPLLLPVLLKFADLDFVSFPGFAVYAGQPVTIQVFTPDALSASGWRISGAAKTTV